MPEIVCIWQICDGLSRVTSHCTLPKNVVQSYHEVQTGVQTVPCIKGNGGLLFCHSVKFQYLHGDWFLVHALCLSGTGVGSSALTPSFMGSELADLELISLCCSDAELDMLYG